MKENVKNITKIALIMLMIICITGSVYAALKCNISIKTEKSEYNKGDTFTVDINISNIESDRGVISFGGTLEYDKDSLKLEKIEGVNGWETPTKGSSYNEANGKFVITKNGLGKNDETIFKLTFTVKNESKQNVVISLKDMTLADGIAPAKTDATSKSITIKDGTQNPDQKPGDGSNTDNNQKPGDSSNTDNNQKPGDGSNTGNSSNNNNNQKPGNNTNTTNIISKGDNTITNQKIPKTGNKSSIVIIGIGITIVIAILLLIKMKFIKE